MKKTRNFLKPLNKKFKGMKKIIICLMMGIFLLTLVSAELIEPKYIGKQYGDINVIETCVVNGFPCPADFLCNITIADPNLDVIVLNSPMTRNDTIYNYTFVSTDLLGDYEYNIYCSNVSLSGNQEETLRVTTTGREPNIMITVLLLLSSLGLFILALYMHNHAIGFISGLLFSISGTYLMITGLGDLADLYTRSIAYVVIAFGAFIVLVSGYEWLDEME